MGPCEADETNDKLSWKTRIENVEKVIRCTSQSAPLLTNLPERIQRQQRSCEQITEYL